MTFQHEKRFSPVVWAVVADRSRARILSAPWPAGEPWEEAHGLVHEDGSRKAGEVRTDRPGSFGSRGVNHQSGEDATDFRHQTAEQFAAEIVELLESGRTGNRFGKLALVAPPLFLGVLRKKLPSPLAQLVVLELHKDYTQHKLADVGAHLQTELAKVNGAQ